MADIIETLLLLALPASGKSEVRRYLDNLAPETCANDFHMGATVQLDDFPYVHLMQLIDDEISALGEQRIFFRGPDRGFQHTDDWGTLIQLVNEDYDDLVAAKKYPTENAAKQLFERMDAASLRAGAPARIAVLDEAVRNQVADKLEAEARKLIDDKHAGYPDKLAGKTVVIEFARGGPEGSSMPLPGAYGYRHSLAQLSPAILEKATILYIWVTPEESRRKNDNRTDPNDPGSILNHGVPEEVMRGDYGTDDIDWLISQSERAGTVTVKAHDQVYHLAIGRFDNRVDKTTFLRGDKADWPADEVTVLHNELKGTLDEIFEGMK